jgi:hypothetical protein
LSPYASLAKVGLSESAVLYRALAPMGYGPREVDQLEIWEIAVMLGVDAEGARNAVSTPSGRAGLVERMRRAAEAGETKGQLIQVDFPTADEETG